MLTRNAVLLCRIWVLEFWKQKWLCQLSFGRTVGNLLDFSLGQGLAGYSVWHGTKQWIWYLSSSSTASRVFKLSGMLHRAGLETVSLVLVQILGPTTHRRQKKYFCLKINLLSLRNTPMHLLSIDSIPCLHEKTARFRQLREKSEILFNWEGI